MNKRKSKEKRPRSLCEVCNKPGYVGEEIIVTGNGIWIHHGDCHLALIDKGKENSKNQAMGDRYLKRAPTHNTSHDPPLFLLFDK